MTIVLGAAMLLGMSNLSFSFDKFIIYSGHRPCWTRWYNSDSPNNGPGDIELLADLTHEYQGEICPVPMKIQVETVDGVPANKTGQIFHLYSNTGGFICRNDQQSSGKCLDYKVRFQSSLLPQLCWTKWYNRDHAGGQEIQNVTVHGGYNTNVGFICRNEDQKSGKCKDYKVCFHCPCH
uniref:WxxW domain-containing protein n=1 Tax=Nothobranchius furzeri TaxID=105023 RepID=A0A8C6M4P6_NOTFU